MPNTTSTLETSTIATTTTRKRRKARSRSRASFGSVRQLPSGRWQARYSDDHENRYKAPNMFETKREAEAWLATIRADMVRGVWQAPELATITLGDYAAEYLATRLDLSPKTLEGYADLLDRFMQRPLTMPTIPGRRARTIALAEYELGAITIAVVREWHAAALTTARARAEARAETARQRAVKAARIHSARAWARRRGLEVSDTGRLPARILTAWAEAGSPPAPIPPHLEHPAPANPHAGRATVAHAYRLLHLLLQHAVAEGRIQANPATLKGASTFKAPERIPATPAEVNALAEHMPERYAAAVHLAAWSGLRAGELFGLARQHLDLEAGTVRVERAAVTSMTTQRPHLGDVKTPTSRRTVHLPAHVLAIMADHLERFTDPSPDALIFTDEHGHIVSRETRQRNFTKARQAVGRPDLRWHDLRHTGATLAAQAGASTRELQHRLGHATVHAAMIYQHASAERDREIAQRLDALATASNVVPLTRPAMTRTGATA